MVSRSKVGDRSRNQRASLAHIVLLVVDPWCSWFGLDRSLHLAVENQRLDSAMGWLGRSRVSRQGLKDRSAKSRVVGQARKRPARVEP